MITKIKNSIFSKPVAFLLSVSFLFLSFKSQDGKIVLSAGTQIQLETISTINSGSILPGQTIDFKVASDVKADGKVLIAAGSIAKGQVMRAEKARGLGKPGHLEVKIKSVTAVDGQQVLLAGSNIDEEGKDQETLALVLGIVVCILLLTIKGKNAEVPIGYSFPVSVATNMTIDA